MRSLWPGLARHFAKLFYNRALFLVIKVQIKNSNENRVNHFYRGVMKWQI